MGDLLKLSRNSHFRVFGLLSILTWFHNDPKILSILYLCGHPCYSIKNPLVQKNCWSIFCEKLLLRFAMWS